jgi:hypothetical protein
MPPEAADARFRSGNVIVTQLVARSSTYVPSRGGKKSTLIMTSLTSLALAGNRGKDSNIALQQAQCQRWRITSSSKSSVLWGAMISWLHRTQRIPNIRRLFIRFIARSHRHVALRLHLGRDHASYVTASE